MRSQIVVEAMFGNKVTYNVASKILVFELVVEFKNGIDGEVDPASLLEHDEGLDGVQRCRVGRR